MLNDLLKDFLDFDLNEMRPQGFLEKRAADISRNVENVNERSGWIPVVKCPVCEKEERAVVLERCGKEMVQCFHCSCVYMSEIPKKGEDVYNDADYMPMIRDNSLDNVDYRKLRFGNERLGIIKKYLKTDSKVPKLWDVGCGAGWFLELSKANGFEVYGQEAGVDLAKFTSEKLGIPVWSELLPDLEIEERFDVITLFDVIEHVRDPIPVMKAIEKFLKPGGIALIFTPNYDSFCIQHIKERSSQVMPAEHLFLFTEKSFRLMVEKVGLKVAHFETKGIDIPDIYSYYRDETDQDQVANFLKEHCSALQAMIDQSGHANHMRFVLTK